MIIGAIDKVLTGTKRPLIVAILSRGTRFPLSGVADRRSPCATMVLYLMLDLYYLLGCIFPSALCRHTFDFLPIQERRSKFLEDKSARLSLGYMQPYALYT
jgi:hypothetical protein